MSMLEYASLIAGISGPLVAYVMIKRSMSTKKIYMMLDEITSEIGQDVNMQKKIYGIGGLLGQGLRQGLGMGGKGAKFNWENLLGQGAQIIMNKMFNKEGSASQDSSQPIGDNAFG